MVIKVYVSGMSGNKEVKKRQQRVTMIMDSKHIEYTIIDITEPGHEGEKDFMQVNAEHKGCTISDPNPRHALPPQLFNDTEYCGDYEDFDLANEMDSLEVFLKLAAPTAPEVEHKNGASAEETAEDGAAVADEDENKENKTEDNTDGGADAAAEDGTNEGSLETNGEAKDTAVAAEDTLIEADGAGDEMEKDESINEPSMKQGDSESDGTEQQLVTSSESIEGNDKAADEQVVEDILGRPEPNVESSVVAPSEASTGVDAHPAEYGCDESKDSTHQTNNVETLTLSEEKTRSENSNPNQNESVGVSMEMDVVSDMKNEENVILDDEETEESVEAGGEYETSEDEKDSQKANDDSKLDCETDVHQVQTSAGKEKEEPVLHKEDSAESGPPSDSDEDDTDRSVKEYSGDPTSRSTEEFETSIGAGSTNENSRPPSPSVAAEEPPCAVEMDADGAGPDAEEQQLLQTSAAFLAGKSEDADEIEIDETTEEAEAEEEEAQSGQDDAGEDGISSKLVDSDDPMMIEQEE